MVRTAIKVLILLLLALGQTGCIREGLEECNEEYFVTIKVVDAITGEDITTSGKVSYADLFIFDADEKYRCTLRADSNQIRRKIPVSITLENSDHCWISVWGNLDGDRHAVRLEDSNALDNSTVSTFVEEGANQSQTPGDLFFGIAQIGKSLKSPTRNEEIVISRKNARMYLTVRGLPDLHKAEDYYFTIHLNDNGYNFRGIPFPNEMVIKQNGAMLANNDFVSLSPFNLVHTDETREDYATVCLYKRAGAEYGEDILIANINSDLNGNPIVLPVGRTANLLVDLRQEISVHIKVTPWDEIEQWVEW